jgi:hypothetical protein
MSYNMAQAQSNWFQLRQPRSSVMVSLRADAYALDSPNNFQSLGLDNFIYIHTCYLISKNELLVMGASIIQLGIQS